MADIDIDTKKQEENQEESLNLKEIEEMYRVGVHFAYSRSFSHPKMRRFLLPNRDSRSVFNLDKVLSALKEAECFLRELGKSRKKILLVSTKPEARDVIERAGRELEMPYVAQRWLGGTLTNFEIMKERIDCFKKIKSKKTSGEFADLSKKEAARLDKKIRKMEEYFGGLELLDVLPAGLMVIDSKNEGAAVAEAKKMNIPVVAVMNSDCDLDEIDFPIPANDNSASSVQYLIEKLVVAYKTVVE